MSIIKTYKYIYNFIFVSIIYADYVTSDVSSDDYEGDTYKYVVTKEDEGKDVIIFWRGNETTLWNCSVTLSYEEYKTGKNCVKVTGWNNQGSVYSK